MPILSESLYKDTHRNTLHTGVPYLDEEFAILHAEALLGNNTPITAKTNFNKASSANKTYNSPTGRTSNNGHEIISPESAGLKTPSKEVYDKGVPIHSFTEISGFPGVGKTALWLSLALDTLCKGSKVCYISCNYTGFPISRARLLSGWKQERFEPRIESYYIDKIEQLMLLESKISSAASTVIVDHYDQLINYSWPRETKNKAAGIIARTLDTIASNKCVIATSTCIPYNIMGNDFVLAPSFRLDPKKKPKKMVRLLIYKDLLGNSVLSSGVAFKIDSDGCIAPIERYDNYSPLAFSVLSTKKRRNYNNKYNKTRKSTEAFYSTNVDQKRKLLSQGSPVERSVFQMQSPISQRLLHTPVAKLRHDVDKCGNTVNRDTCSSPTKRFPSIVECSQPSPEETDELQLPSFIPLPIHRLNSSNSSGHQGELSSNQEDDEQKEEINQDKLFDCQYIPNSQAEGDDPFMIISSESFNSSASYK